MRYLGYALVVGSIAYVLGNYFMGWFDDYIMGFDSTIVCGVAFLVGTVIIYASPKIGP
jgi:hypothetical protein